ncbi:MAG: ABC transporter permease [Acidimicrobiales bacterium]|nr:ABC transporter permease [Acidimicrobiales bacterium]
MKSSNEEPSAEGQQIVDENAPIEDAKRFDVSALPLETTSQKVIRRIDFPVQIARIAILAFIIWIWQSRTIFAGFNLFGIDFLPEIIPLFQGVPTEAWDYIAKVWDDKLFWQDFWVTLQEALLGFTYGALSGFIIGMVLGRFKKAKKVFSPFLIFTNAVPKIALAPILILWYGVDIGSKVALATIIVFFIVQIPVMAAVGGVDPDLDTVASSMGASQLQKFRLVVLPSILGPLFGALRLASVYAILSVVFGEFLASKRGLGQRLLYQVNNFGMGAAIALMSILAFLALFFNAGIGIMERKFLRWQDDSTRGNVVSL